MKTSGELLVLCIFLMIILIVIGIFTGAVIITGI